MWSIEYRPKKLEEFFGNKDVVRRIKKYLEVGNLPKTMIFYGESGCGKTTMARIVGNSLDVEILEFNTANMRGIDTVREIIEICRYQPFLKKKRLIIFDEAHRITRDGQEAMLKLLEGEDRLNYFILCTTDVEGLIETIRNRAKMFVFRGLDFDECKELVEWLSKRTGKKWNEEIVMAVWRLCKGVPRLIVNVLEEVNELEDVERVFSKLYFAEVDADFGEIARLLLEGRLSWRVLQSRIAGMDERDLERLWHVLKGYVLKVMLNTTDEEKWLWYCRVLDVLSRVKDVYGFIVGLSKLILERK